MRPHRRPSVLAALLLLAVLAVSSAALAPQLSLASSRTSSIKPPTTLPAWRQSVADCVTGDHFVEGRKHNQPDPGCDDWAVDLYERPYNNSNHDHYYADQDLVRVQAADDANWYYFRIELYGQHSRKLDALYGIEADVDGDSCFDWFWTTKSPTANIQQKVGYNAWNRDGVIAFFDANNDVGGKRCGSPDAGWSGNGYERLVSDQGSGEGLWAMSPSGAQDRVVILAVQKQMLARQAGGMAPVSLRWRGWASKGLQDPANFHHHDKYTSSQAGSAYKGQANFPTQNVYEGDNTNGLGALNLYTPAGVPTNTPIPPTATATRAAATSASTSGVVPVERSLSNSRACEALGYAYEYKVDPPRSGTYGLAQGNDSVTTSIDANTIYLSWSASIGIDAVVVKGGQTANVYVYTPEARADSRLHSPVNASGKFAQISHVSFCYDIEQVSPTSTPVPPTATATSTPVPPTATATSTPVPPTPQPSGSTVSGTVYSDTDYSWTRESEEPVIAGVMVEIYRDDGDGTIGPEDSFVGQTTSDDSGGFTFPGLEEGTYFVQLVGVCGLSGIPMIVDGQQPIVIDVAAYSCDS